jgi:hypothetical protein
MNPAFVFLHVGPDLALPTLLVRSLRAMHRRAEITQCSDKTTPVIDGVDAVSRLPGDTGNLMTFRLESFARLNRPGSALYLDTDMLCVKSLDPDASLNGCDVAVCSREFNREDALNTRFRGLDLSEYTGKTLGEVYPFVACATVSVGGSFWADCLANLSALHPKFHCWYGDQEAIRNVIHSGKYKAAFLPEGVYGCLPERRTGTPPSLLHFKGAARKPIMLEYAREMRLI